MSPLWRDFEDFKPPLTLVDDRPSRECLGLGQVPVPGLPLGFTT